MYNEHLVYKVVIWVFFGISLWTEKVALIMIHLFLFATDRRLTIEYTYIIKTFTRWDHSRHEIVLSADLKNNNNHHHNIYSPG